MCPIDAKKQVPGVGGEGSRSTLFLFFLLGSPRYGADGAKVQQGAPCSLREWNKAQLPSPIPGPGYPLLLLGPYCVGLRGNRCYPSRGER